MNNLFVRSPDGCGAGNRTGARDSEATASNRYPIRDNVVSIRRSVGRLSFVTISVDEEGHLEYDSRFEPSSADRIVDALLLMLIRARQVVT